MGLINRIISMAKGIVVKGTDRADSFINDLDAIYRNNALEYFAWYSGESSRLMNTYKELLLFKYNKNPIYNKNKRKYFWAESSIDDTRKRVHSGIPRFLADTLVSNVDFPKIIVDGKWKKECERLAFESEFNDKAHSSYLPLSLVGGTGVIKPVFDATEGDDASFSFYKENEFKLITSGNSIIGVVFEDFIEDEKKDKYLLAEIRRVDRTGEKPVSIIEYRLYKASRSMDDFTDMSQMKEVPLDTVKGLKEKCVRLEFEGVNEPLCTVLKLFDDPDRKGYGKSIYAGKVDLFDDLDLAVSQQSRAVQLSTPVEYLNTDYLDKDSQGRPIRPSTYDRQYIEINGHMNGDGEQSDAVRVTQPDIRINEYQKAIEGIERLCIAGWMSNATIGLDGSSGDNADATREREKVTRRTVEIIRRRMTKAIKSSLRQGMMLKHGCLGMQEGNRVSLGEGEISEDDIIVRYPEFSAPSFEARANILMPMYVSNAISTDKYVDMLYKGEMSNEEKSQEIARLKSAKPINNASKRVPGESRTDKEREVGNYRDNLSYAQRSNSHATLNETGPEGK